MALRKRGNFLNLLQKEGGTQKVGIPQKRGGSSPGGNYGNIWGPYGVTLTFHLKIKTNFSWSLFKAHRKLNVN